MPSSHQPPFVSRFESLGASIPERRLTTADLMSQVKMWVDVDLEDLTGIRERRVCSEGEDSYTLSVNAALDCLNYSSHEAGDLDDSRRDRHDPLVDHRGLNEHRHGLHLVARFFALHHGLADLRACHLRQGWVWLEQLELARAPEGSSASRRSLSAQAQGLPAWLPRAALRPRAWAIPASVSPSVPARRAGRL